MIDKVLNTVCNIGFLMIVGGLIALIWSDDVEIPMQITLTGMVLLFGAAFLITAKRDSEKDKPK